MAVLGTLAGDIDIAHYCDISVLGVQGLNTRLKIVQFSVALTSCGRQQVVQRGSIYTLQL